MTLVNAIEDTQPSIPPPQNRTAQVLVLMTTDERQDLERIAKVEHRSLSATARLMIRRGLREYQSETLIAD